MTYSIFGPLAFSQERQWGHSVESLYIRTIHGNKFIRRRRKTNIGPLFPGYTLVSYTLVSYTSFTGSDKLYLTNNVQINDHKIYHIGSISKSSDKPY